MFRLGDKLIKNIQYGAIGVEKIFYGTLLVYQNGEPVEETFAITKDISTFAGVFDWVYDKTRMKWYRLNNLGKYEEYGIYGTSIGPEYGVQITNGYYVTQVTQNTKMRIEADFTTPETLTTTSCFITGVRNATSSSSTNQTYCIAFMGKALRMDAGNTSNINLYTVAANTRYKVIYDLDGTTLNWSIADREGNVLASGTKTISSPASSDLNTFAVGALNRSTGAPVSSTQEFTYWEIKYYKDDVLVADYKFDKNQNMYDTLSSYSTAAGDGTIVTKKDYSGGGTAYKGKLSIVDGIEYQYNGTAWEIVPEDLYPVLGATFNTFGYFSMFDTLGDKSICYDVWFRTPKSAPSSNTYLFGDGSGRAILATSGKFSIGLFDNWMDYFIKWDTDYHMTLKYTRSSATNITAQCYLYNSAETLLKSNSKPITFSGNSKLFIVGNDNTPERGPWDGRSFKGVIYKVIYKESYGYPAEPIANWDTYTYSFAGKDGEPVMVDNNGDTISANGDVELLRSLFPYPKMDAPTLIINFATQAEFESYTGKVIEGQMAFVEETGMTYIRHNNAWEETAD